MIDELLVELEGATPSARRSLLRNLPPLDDPALLAGVARWLGDPSPSVCEAAVEVLVRAGGRAAADAAAGRIRAADPAERGYAVDVLRRIGQAAVPAIGRLLTHSDRDTRKYGAEVLAGIGDRAALAALLALLRDPDVTVCAAAAETIGQLRLAEAAPALAEAMETGEDWLRLAAVYALGQIGGHAGLDHLAALPADVSPVVLAAAVEALGQAAAADPSRAASLLAGLLVHADPLLAELTLAQLGAILAQWSELTLPAEQADAVSITALAGLQASDPSVRAASAHCLSHHGSTPAEAVIGALRERAAEDRSPVVRLAAVEALSHLGAADAAWLLARAADANESPAVRGATLRALAAVATEPTETTGLNDLLIRLTGDREAAEIRVTALALLFERAPHLAAAPALALLADELLYDDEDALAALLACPAAQRLAMLEPLLASDDSDADIRRAAFTTLAPVDPPAARAALVAAEGAPALLIRAAHNADWRIRAHALRLVVGAEATWARRLAHAAVLDTDARVRVRAVEALASGACAAGEAVLLHGRLTDENGWVRRAALDGLRVHGQINAETLTLALADQFPPVRGSALRAALWLCDTSPTPLPDALRAELVRVAGVAALDDDPEIVGASRALLGRVA